MANEIIEKAGGVEQLVLVGIQRRGVELAERLAQHIEKSEGSKILRGKLDIALYRDDLQTLGPVPVVDRGGRELPIQPDIAGVTITVPPGQVVRVSVQERDGRDAVELVPKATS